MDQLNWVEPAVEVIRRDPDPRRRAALFVGLFGLVALVVISGVMSFSAYRREQAYNFPVAPVGGAYQTTPILWDGGGQTNKLLEQMLRDQAASDAKTCELLDQVMRESDAMNQQMIRMMRGW